MSYVKTLLMVTCFVTMAARSEAATIAACAGASSTCTFEGTEYFCEKACTGGACTPLPTTDGCPGRCSKTPWIACATDGPCNGTGNACINSGPIKACIAGSARAGEACYGDGDCNTVRGNPTTCTVSGASCCDSSGLSAVGDGVLALCGSNSTGTADTITLTTPPSGTHWVVCARAGNDTITGGDGEDSIDGGDGDDILTGNNATDRIYGGDGDDTITLGAAPYYLAGDDFADGGAGDDDIYGTNRFLGSGGDNILIGGDGSDYILSGSGRDDVVGGDGNDTIGNAFAGIGLFVDDAVGSLVCGGAGDDNLIAWGPSHQCMDGGAGTDTCNYDYHTNATQTSKDVGTARNCETVTGSVVSGRPASCGCD